MSHAHRRALLLLVGSVAFFVVEMPALLHAAAMRASGADRAGGLGGGGPLDQPATGASCVPATLKERVHALPFASPGAGAISQLAAPPLLKIRPLGGNDYEDVFPGGFVDLDAGPGWKNFSCHDFTYNGHAGHDIGLRSFAEQALGVPVFAVRDGVVLFAQDGFGDMNTSPSGDDGNYLILDHGAGETGWYFHLKKNSVAFSVGQSVAAGAQVGLAASSGWSWGPHLHFGIERNFAPYEPSAGPCRKGASAWAHQELLRTDTFLTDFGVTVQDLFSWPTGLPHPMPVENQFTFSDGFVWFWMQGGNLTPNSTWRVVFVKPDGSVDSDSGTQPMNNPDWERNWWRWFYFWVNDMHTIAGTWRIQVHLNGVLQVDAPVEVVPTFDPNFNRAPEPIAAVLEPAVPDPDAPVTCRVLGPVVLDDLDWDVVRYRYVWQVNGSTVRDVTHAGRADTIPRNVAVAGDALSCTVTPSDGLVSGTPAPAGATFTEDPWLNVGASKPGSPDVPLLVGSGPLVSGSLNALALSQARPSSFSLLFIGLQAGFVPFTGGTLVPFPVPIILSLSTDAAGGYSIPFVWPAGIPAGTTLVAQAWISDPGASVSASASNGVIGSVP